MLSSSQAATIIVKTNKYLKDVLQIPYALELSNYTDILTRMRNKLAHSAEVSQDDLLELTKISKRAPTTKILNIIDLKKNIQLSLNDIGVGISQVIPVVVGSINDKNIKQPTILSIEQPELHLHPSLQCALADIFIKEKSKSRIFLLETHSEHLILRLLRRISETTEETLKDNSLKLNTEEIAVLYIDSRNENVTVTELGIDSEGEFTTKWPEGFFEERATELFGESDA